IEAPAPGEKAARNIAVQGNSFRGDAEAAIAAATADHVRILDNTLSDPSGERARGILLERSRGVLVRRNMISSFPVAIRGGAAGPGAATAAPSQDAAVDRNYLDGPAGGGAGIDIEAGREVRVANNVVSRYGPAVAVLGVPPATRSVTIANNLFL